MTTGAMPQAPTQCTSSTVKSMSSVFSPAWMPRYRSTSCEIKGAPDTWQAVPWQHRMVFLACGFKPELRVESGDSQGRAERLAGRLGHPGHHVFGQPAEDRLCSLQKGDQCPPFPSVMLQQFAELFF